MKISFDLDGVIANTDKWFFRLLNVLYAMNGGDENLLYLMEMDYYASRPLKYHPNLLMAQHDEGFIITSRKPRAKRETEKWLRKYGVTLPIIYSDHNDEIDWTDYAGASVVAGRYKASIISERALFRCLGN